MRRKKGRSTYSFQAMISIEATTILWASIVSLYFIASGSCDDAAFNTKLSTTSGHVESATPAMQPEMFTNYSTSSSPELIETNQQIHSDQSSTSSSTSRGKRTFRQSGNELWDGIINDCLYKPSFSCFQKNVYTYLDNTLKLGDVNVTERIQFKRIDIDPKLLEQLQNHTDDEHDNEISHEETREFRSGLLSYKRNVKVSMFVQFLTIFLPFFFSHIFRIANRRSHGRTVWQMAKFHDDA